MATLEKIRNQAGLLVIVIGLALFAFIIGDFLRSGSTFFHQSKEKIVIVDGESINYLDFQKKVEEETERYKSQSRSSSVPDEVQAQIREQVYEMFVSQILMDKESEEIGLTVGKEELKDMIMGNNISPTIQQMPDFQNPQTGQFDRNRLLQFLQMIESDDFSSYPDEAKAQIMSAKSFWVNFEKQLQQQQLQMKFTSLLANALVPNSLDAKAAFEDSKVSVDFNYVSQLYASIADDQVSVSDSEIKALYEKRKNGCTQEAGKVIRYIAVDIAPSQQDYNDVEARVAEQKDAFAEATDVADIVSEYSEQPYVDAFFSLNQLDPNVRNFAENSMVGSVEGPVLSNQAYNLYKLVDKTVAPDSIQWSQIMLAGSVADDAVVSHVADSLIQVIKGGKTFAEIAEEATGGQSNGEMGWQTEAQLLMGTDAKFAKTVFNAKVNDIFVAKSNYGTHLVQVTSKTTPVAKYKVATLQMSVSASTPTRDGLYADLAQYASKNNGLDAFKSAATEAGYTCNDNVTVLPNQPSLSAIKNSRQVIRWAFEHKRGDISEIYDCQSHYIVAMVDGSIKEGPCSLAAMTDALKRELINQKKGEKIAADLKAKNLSSLEQYADAMASSVQEVKFVSFSTPRISGIGVEPVINAEAPQAAVGKVTGPLVGKAGVYVLNVTDKQASDATFDLNAQKQSLQSSMFYRVYQAPQVLKKKADIEDNRIRFY